MGTAVVLAHALLTVRMGCCGLYLAMSRAVLPVTVNTTISAACSLVAARTAAVASASVCGQKQQQKKQNKGRRGQQEMQGGTVGSTLPPSRASIAAAEAAQAPQHLPQTPWTPITSRKDDQVPHTILACRKRAILACRTRSVVHRQYWLAGHHKPMVCRLPHLADVWVDAVVASKVHHRLVVRKAVKALLSLHTHSRRAHTDQYAAGMSLSFKHTSRACDVMSPQMIWFPHSSSYRPDGNSVLAAAAVSAKC
jgi:hypothetical protein